jgi:hypothetical protein
MKYAEGIFNTPVRISCVFKKIRIIRMKYA